MIRNQAETPAKTAGRPGLPQEQIAAVLDCKRKGLTPKEAVERTGVKKTKVYELYRIESTDTGAA